MGANHIGEIELLSKIAEPEYGYITNFGKAHLEGFGSEEGVIKGKTELYEFLKKSSGFIFYNSDDNKQKKNISNYKNKFSFGKESSDLNYSVKTDNSGIIIEVDNIIIKSSLFGNYNITNIVSAISIGYYFGISKEKIKEGISNYIPSNNRSQIVKKSSNKIVLDAYNANPTSMTLAIKSFDKSDLKNKILILGDMHELGKEENKFHQEIVDYCETLVIDRVFLVGEIFSKTIFTEKFISCKNYKELLNKKDFKNIINSNILIKGSRGMQLEKIVDFIS
jgi:UDP-N-acetylmuramoyl-tripeptide--D-alanyl-D-alanine ligase